MLAWEGAARSRDHSRRYVGFDLLGGPGWAAGLVELILTLGLTSGSATARWRRSDEAGQVGYAPIEARSGKGAFHQLVDPAANPPPTTRTPGATSVAPLNPGARPTSRPTWLSRRAA